MEQTSSLHHGMASWVAVCQYSGIFITADLLPWSRHERAEAEVGATRASQRRGAPARAGTLLQSRAVVAAVQSPRNAGGTERAPSRARAFALFVNLIAQHRRVLHGARGRALRPGCRWRHA